MIRAAHEFGLDPWEIGRRWTNRQFTTLLAWLDLQWDIPSRTDNYLMAIAAEVRRGLVKDPERVDVNDLKLRFKTSGKKDGPKVASDEEVKRNAEVAKAAWMERMGGNVRIIHKSQEEHLADLRRRGLIDD